MKHVLLYQTTKTEAELRSVSEELTCEEEEMKIPVIQHPPIVKKASSKRPLVLFAPVGKMNSSVSCGNMIMTFITSHILHVNTT